MLQRTISNVRQHQGHPGFLGTGHTAIAVLDGVPYTQSDPFIVFMDDQLDLPGGEPVGGAHPHAGFETLTLVLEGNEDWKTGSFELMTAGNGIVHTEEIKSATKLRILQVWLVLPPAKRWAVPFWQKILLEDVPTIKKDDYEIRVYSGSSNGLTSPLQNATPLTLVDFRMKADQTIKQVLPANYTGLIYVLKGAVKLGEEAIAAGQSGWLNNTTATGDSELSFYSLEADTHFVLYAARPHQVPVVAHGPFVGDTVEDINRLYKAYREGAMPHLEDLPKDRRIEFGPEAAL